MLETAGGLYAVAGGYNIEKQDTYTIHHTEHHVCGANYAGKPDAHARE
jgi:hypothetical protein